MRRGDEERCRDGGGDPAAAAAAAAAAPSRVVSPAGDDGGTRPPRLRPRRRCHGDPGARRHGRRRAHRPSLTAVAVAAAVAATAAAVGPSPAAACAHPYSHERCNAGIERIVPCFCPVPNWFYTWSCCLPAPDVLDDPEATKAFVCWCESLPTGRGLGALGALVFASLGCLAVAGVNAWRGVSFQVVDETEED